MDIVIISKHLKMKLIKFKEYKLVAITFCNIILFLFLYYQHRIYLSQGAIICYGNNCNNSNLEKKFSDVRNERSTPTEFILPSSTVVAKIQEEKKSKRLNVEEMNCLIKLDDLGFKILDLTSASNANSIAAIFEFQENLNIRTNGKLDTETRSNLGC